MNVYAVPANREWFPQLTLEIRIAIVARRHAEAAHVMGEMILPILGLAELEQMELERAASEVAEMVEGGRKSDEISTVDMGMESI